MVNDGGGLFFVLHIHHLHVGLSDPRDFLAPVAAFEERSCTHRIVAKFAGSLFESSLDHSPYNVVAWYADKRSNNNDAQTDTMRT